MVSGGGRPSHAGRKVAPTRPSWWARVPHDYLNDLTSLVDAGRPVVFYDQLGCGKSDHPDDVPLPGVGTPDPESDIWQQADRRSEPTAEEPPEVHQLVRQRLRQPWTSSDVNPRISPVDGQIAGPGGLHATTAHMT